jgi:redox-sensitive bicupin YhaK (pirin superfamily)
MLQVKKADERGHAKFDWLDSYHTFSFRYYYEAKQIG